MQKKLLVSIFAIFLMCLIWVSTGKSEFSKFEGDSTFYLDSASSLARVCKDEEFNLAFCITGESIEIEKPLDVNEVLRLYSAKLVYLESTFDGVSYYAYSPRLKNKTIVSGRKVNLHVHVKKDRTVIGTPLIFGSF